MVGSWGELSLACGKPEEIVGENSLRYYEICIFNSLKLQSYDFSHQVGQGKA